MRVLLEHGAAANGAAGATDSPLALACENGYVEAVELLLLHGADATWTDGRGHTIIALERCMASSHANKERIASMLSQAE